MPNPSLRRRATPEEALRLAAQHPTTSSSTSQAPGRANVAEPKLLGRSRRASANRGRRNAHNTDPPLHLQVPTRAMGGDCGEGR